MNSAIRKAQPFKIDIGAVFSLPPKEHNTVQSDSFKPIERELVFDIDMTDYDDVRTCCTGADICNKCWPFMTMSIKVVDLILRDDFGYQHILWVYSGRRGVHCWVCDKTARELPNEVRSAIIDYMTVKITDSDSPLRKELHIHPMIKRAYEILEPYFGKHIADSVNGQGILEEHDSYVRILNTLPNEKIRKDLYDEWERNELTGLEKWNQIITSTTEPSSLQRKSQKINYNELERWRMSLVLKYCYPRLDANVSKAQNHLLKSPFCVHPKTGRVCVPIDPIQADFFDPFTVPTIQSLCQQLDSSTQTTEENVSLQTDMKDHLDCFNNTFMQNLWITIRREIRERSEQKAALNVDF